MALSDLTYSLCRIADFIYNMVEVDFHANSFCVSIGAAIASLVYSQAVLVVMASLNALLMTVYGRVLSLGRYDGGLLLLILGGSFIIVAIGVPIEAFGPDKAW